MLKDFVQNGYTVIDLTDESELHTAVSSIENRDGVEFSAEVDSVLFHPKVHSALKIILGDDYVWHSHRAIFSGLNPANWNWHRDWRTFYQHAQLESTWSENWFFLPWNRHHHCRLVHVLYFPTMDLDTTSGTGFLTNTQYYDDVHKWDTVISETPPYKTWVRLDTKTLDWKMEPLRLRSEGKVVISHSDIWHRAYQPKEGEDRLVVKAVCMRAQDPIEIAFPNSSGPYESWYQNLDMDTTLNYHWNWYHGKHLTLDSKSTFADAVEKRNSETYGGRLDSIYFMAGVSDYDSMINEMLTTLNPSWESNLATALAFNRSCKDELAGLLKSNELIWRKRAAVVDILSNMGKGDEELVTLWIDLLKTNEGITLLNLIQGTPIVCAGNVDALNVLVERLNNPGALKVDLILYELLMSIDKISKTCGVVPDISSKLDELIISHNPYIVNNAKQSKKNLGI